MTSLAHASYESAEKLYGRGTINLSGYRKTLIELIKDGYYFSVIPWMKDYIVKTDKKTDSELDEALDSMLYHTGVKTFESLPEAALKKAKSGNIKYILAKKLFKKGKASEALAELTSIPGGHSAYPFVAHLKGVIYSSLNNLKEAESQFRDCVRTSDSAISKTSSTLQKNQLLTNKDYCLSGVARVQFASGHHEAANLTYLDISKDSFIWPEILFEEAWASYYQKNYNRTLGKLITYKAPVFDFIFNPEVDVLKALTYLKMCLYDDAKKTVDEFYQSHLNESREFRKFIRSRGRNYKYYYELMADFEKQKLSPLSIVDNALRSIRKDAVYKEMKGALVSAIAEYNKIRKTSKSNMNSNLIKNIKVVTDEYRTTLGAYIRAAMVTKYAELYSAFQGMSYIKLEVLAQRKEKLYQTDVIENKKRGDVKYIDRNDKQYFWTFNGEFWADELGDYVLALRSEC